MKGQQSSDETRRALFERECENLRIEIPAEPGDLAEHRPAHKKNIENSIPGYTILEKIGEGKFGILYKARQHSLQRWVSIKLLKPELVSSRKSIERFRREIKAWGQLEHPNILRALDSNEVDGLHYVVAEYFEGIHLPEYIRTHGAMPETEALAMGAKLASALSHIWSKNMVHRDVIPENILVSKQDVKLCDLGLLRALEQDSKCTSYQIPRRAYAYVPPEQILGKTLNFQSDIYSLGAVLYFAISGHQTREDWDCDPENLAQRIVPIEHHVPGIGRETRDFIAQMLSPSPEKRWSSQKTFAYVFARTLERHRGTKTGFLRRSRAYSFLWLLASLVFLAAQILFEAGASLRSGSDSLVSPVELFQNCAPGVVVVQSGELLGSGVIISHGGAPWILTNAHLIRDLRNVRITLRDGRSFTTVVVRRASDKDLALAAWPSHCGDYVSIPMAGPNEIRVGEDVFVIGHPKDYRWSLTRGTISGIREDTIQTDASISMGNSGGPILNSKGQMVGIATYTIGKSSPIGFAISTERIQRFLESDAF